MPIREATNRNTVNYDLAIQILEKLKVDLSNPGAEEDTDGVTDCPKPRSAQTGYHRDADLSQVKGEIVGEDPVFFYNGTQLVSKQKLGEGSFGEVMSYITKTDSGKPIEISIKKVEMEKYGPGRGREGELKNTNELKIIYDLKKAGRLKGCEIVPAEVIKDKNGSSSIKEESFSYEEGQAPFLNEVDSHTYGYIAVKRMDGDLHYYLKQLGRRAAGQQSALIQDFKKILQIFKKVLVILDCIKRAEYYYTDLKPENVLYSCGEGQDDKGISVMIGDLGGISESVDGAHTFTLPRIEKKKKGGNETKLHAYLFGIFIIHSFMFYFDHGYGFEKSGQKIIERLHDFKEAAETLKLEHALPSDRKIPQKLQSKWGKLSNLVNMALKGEINSEAQFIEGLEEVEAIEG